MNAETRRTGEDIAKAIEVFARGFTFTRTFTHPFVPERIGPAWAVRDTPRKSGHYRSEEWIAYDRPAAEIDRLARKHTRGRFGICAIVAAGESDESLRADYKKLGYRLVTTEPMMVHPLKRIPKFSSPAKIVRVITQDAADKLAKAVGSRQILPEHLTPGARLRQYAAMIDDQFVGWVRSITVDDATWCSNMHVVPKFRRRGIGKAMMSQMLRDDRAAGAKSSVLLASHAGAMLYPVVGYQRIATLLMFKPKRQVSQ